MGVIRKAICRLRWLVCGLVTCVFLFSTASCGRVGPLYIEAPVKKTGAEIARLHFFFDKTESMQGFTAKGDDSHYVQTLPLLWQVGDVTIQPPMLIFEKLRKIPISKAILLCF